MESLERACCKRSLMSRCKAARAWSRIEPLSTAFFSLRRKLEVFDGRLEIGHAELVVFDAGVSRHVEIAVEIGVDARRREPAPRCGASE